MWQERVWDVHTEGYFLPGRDVPGGGPLLGRGEGGAQAQVAHECAHLIYHCPGHGEGMEGHQPPYHALGDYTVLRPGMHFSNVPGPYDPEHGCGFNHSNNILVAEGKGLQIGTVPCDKEWCFLEL